MTRNFRRAGAVALSAIVLAAASVTLAMSDQQAPADPFVGTWVLNLAKSKDTPGPPPKSATLYISLQGKMVNTMVDSANAAGAAGHWMYGLFPTGRTTRRPGTPRLTPWR